MKDQINNQDFYWQTARDSLLTVAALRMFQVALKYDGQDFDKVKHNIDQDYDVASGYTASNQRHGGNFNTFLRVFEEAGWMRLEATSYEKILRITPAGRQAEKLFISIPDFLKSAPYFIIEILSRYQLNNPIDTRNVRNQNIRENIKESNVFPYWTIWKIMRSCDNKITSEELRRFVFRIKNSNEIADVIDKIKEYRNDKLAGLTDEQIDNKYPPKLLGAVGEPKYIMGRAGVHVGNNPSLIEKEKQDTYRLSEVYLPLIDEIIQNEPVYKEYIDSNTWFNDYGQPILIEETSIPFSMSVRDIEAELDYPKILDEDPIWQEVKGFLDIGAKNFLFVGPPGTSKTTYALSIGAKLADYQPYRFHNIQFHQSFGYEDFMEGYVPVEDTDRSSGFI